MVSTPAQITQTNGTPATGDGQRDHVVPGLEHELDLVKQALSLLGLRRCSQCGKFFRALDAGTLFDGGELVCRDCVERWWAKRLVQLTVSAREAVQRRLVNWLVSYYGAKVLHRPSSVAADSPGAFRLVANCVQCDGSGTLGGRRCGWCDGRGTVWVAAPRQDGAML